MRNDDITSHYSQENKYQDDVTDLISDMGDLWDRSQRENAAKSMTDDYEGVTIDDAENFIANNEKLFDEGIAANRC